MVVANASHTARRLITGSLLAATAAASLMVTASGASARGPHEGCADAHVQIGHSSTARMQKAVVCLINEQRTERGLPKLVASSKLDRSAQGWTETMVSDSEFSHGAGSAFAARISAAGFDWENVAENIATGYSTPSDVVGAWMRSPGHCANILNPIYREVGTGVANDMIHGASNVDGTWTQDFGRLMGQRALSSNFGPAQGCNR
jgi:uncharacterized protein YkwD